MKFNIDAIRNRATFSSIRVTQRLISKRNYRKISFEVKNIIYISTLPKQIFLMDTDGYLHVSAADISTGYMRIWTNIRRRYEVFFLVGGHPHPPTKQTVQSPRPCKKPLKSHFVSSLISHPTLCPLMYPKHLSVEQAIRKSEQTTEMASIVSCDVPYIHDKLGILPWIPFKVEFYQPSNKFKRK